MRRPGPLALTPFVIILACCPGTALAGDILLPPPSSAFRRGVDRAVHGGPLGVFSEQVPAVCSTGALTVVSLDPTGESGYCLIAARDDAYRGSYGNNAIASGRELES